MKRPPPSIVDKDPYIRELRLDLADARARKDHRAIVRYQMYLRDSVSNLVKMFLEKEKLSKPEDQKLPLEMTDMFVRYIDDRLNDAHLKACPQCGGSGLVERGKCEKIEANWISRV